MTPSISTRMCDNRGIRWLCALWILSCSADVIAERLPPSPHQLLPPSARECPPPSGNYVFDYRDNSADARHWKQLVEGAHFTKSVRRGIAGNTGPIMGDLAYTLNHFPNHPFALSITSQIQRAPGYTDNIAGRRDRYYLSIHCYFHRALTFAPSDPQVYHVIALHFHKLKEYHRAETFYRYAINGRPNIVEAHYNLGLLYLDMQQPVKAMPHAEAAYQAGYPMSGLKNRLAQYGFDISQGASPNGKSDMPTGN